MSLIMQSLAADESPKALFRGDDGVRLDSEANFVLTAEERIIASFDFQRTIQTFRTTTGSPVVNPAVMNIYDWTYSFTPGRILIRSPYSTGKFGATRREKGFATGGYLRYEDIASVNAANYTDKGKKQGRIEIESKGNLQQGGMEIMTIIESDSADTLRKFARVLAEQVQYWWAGKEYDADTFRNRLDEFAGIDWQTVIDELRYIRGLGLYKRENSSVEARWREELPPPPSGIGAVKRTARELGEDARRTAAFLTGRAYKTPKRIRYRDEK
jgi:hypothetical protein